MKKKILTRGMLPYSTSKYSSRYLIPPTFENSLQNLLLELLQLPHHCIFNLAQVLKTTMILIWEKKKNTRIAGIKPTVEVTNLAYVFLQEKPVPDMKIIWMELLILNITVTHYTNLFKDVSLLT